ncbi:MAG: hypothetical protein ACJ716_02625 [Marmoricola sp.]
MARFDGQNTYDPENLAVLDTTGGTTPSSTVRLTKSFANGISDLDVAPNGSQVVVAAPGVGFKVYSTTDASLLGSYPSVDEYTAAVAMRSDGVVATGAIGSISNIDLRFYPAGSPVVMRSVDFGYGPNVHEIAVRPHGLAFGPVHAYAITDLGQLRTYTAGPPAVVKIATDKSVYDYGTTATVTATIASPTTSRTVNVYAKPNGMATVLVATGLVDGTGKFVFHPTKLTRNTTFSAVFSGDDNYAPASAKLAITVRAKTTISSGSTSKSGYFHKLRHSPAPTISVAVYPSKPTTTCVKFVVQIYSSGGWRSLGSIACPNRSATTGRYGVTMHNFLARDRIRVQAIYPTTSLNATYPSAWYYVLFV